MITHIPQLELNQIYKKNHIIYYFSKKLKYIYIYIYIGGIAIPLQAQKFGSFKVFS
jgi:hypothetical protein